MRIGSAVLLLSMLLAAAQFAFTGAEEATAAPLALPFSIKFNEKKGFVIAAVEAGASTGFKVGDVLSKVGDHEVSTHSVEDALQAGHKDFVVPVVAEPQNDDEEPAYPVVGFIRVEFIPGTDVTVKGNQVNRAQDLKQTPLEGVDGEPVAVGLLEHFEAAAGGGAGGDGAGDDGDGGGDDTFVAVFPTAGPMGVELATTKEGYLSIKAVVEGGAAKRAGIQRGDMLLSVNDEIIPMNSPMATAVQILSKASFPKSLELRMGPEHLSSFRAQRQMQARAAARAGGAPTPFPNGLPPSMAGHMPPGHMPAVRGMPRMPVPAPASAQARKRQKKVKKKRKRGGGAGAGSTAPELGDDEFEVLYTAEAFGLVFDATSTKALVISSVDPHGPSSRNNLKPGDIVVRVNNVNLIGIPFRDAVDKLRASKLPRTLRIKRPEDKSSDGDVDENEGKGYLQLTSPEPVAGFTVPVMSALFGTNVSSCDVPIRFVLAQPMDACVPLQPMGNLAAAEVDESGAAAAGTDVVAAAATATGDADADADADAGDAAGDDDAGPQPLTFALVIRGICTFPDKAKAAQAAGADGIVVISDGKPVVRMPGAGTKLNISAVMTSQQHGFGLRGATATGDIRGKFMMHGDEGCEFDPEEDADALIPELPTPETKLEREQGGRFMIWNGVNTTAVPFVMAMFGPEPNPGLLAPIVVPKPDHACLGEYGTFKNFGDLQNAYAVVTRGKCPMIDKARALQRAGIAGVMIVNTDDKLTVIPAPPPTDDVLVPVVMVPNSLLEDAAWTPERASVGRLVTHDVE